MRSSGGTKFALPCVVVACTKSTIAFFAAPSFHDGRGSFWANACVPRASAAASTRTRGNCEGERNLMISRSDKYAPRRARHMLLGEHELNLRANLPVGPEVGLDHVVVRGD